MGERRPLVCVGTVVNGDRCSWRRRCTCGVVFCMVESGVTLGSFLQYGSCWRPEHRLAALIVVELRMQCVQP